MPYRDEISGLKALAILAIVLFHYDVAVVPGGFFGLDVFFVISGFAATSFVRSKLAERSFSFLDFYGRCARWLVPALLVVLVFALVAGFVIQQPADLEHLSKSGAFAALFSSNIFFTLDTDYFNSSAAKLPLLHTWPVATLAQLLVLLPALIVLLRKAHANLILAVIGTLAVATFAWNVWGPSMSQTAAYYLPPSRAWELLAGSMLAFAPRPKLNRVVAGVVGLGGLALILAAAAILDEWSVKKAIVPVVGAMAVIFSLGYESVAAKLLAWKPAVFVGKISYSWFLWHWPLIAFYKYLDGHDGSLWPRLALAMISFGLAVASWRYIEQPFRGRRERAPSTSLLLGGLGASITVCVVFSVVAMTHGAPGRSAILSVFVDKGLDGKP